MHTIRHYDDPASYPRIKNGEVAEYLTETDNYDYLGKSASPTDMTGLITHGPTTDAALDSYQDVYPFLIPAIDPMDDTHDAVIDPMKG